MNYLKYTVVFALMVATAGVQADENAAKRKDKAWTPQKLPEPVRYQGATEQQRILQFRQTSVRRQQDQVPSERPPSLPKEDQQVASRPDSFFENWPRRTVGEIKIDVQDRATVVPVDRTVKIIETTSLPEWKPNLGSPQVFAWAAPDIRYRPLYFEDVALERYGQTHGLRLQPVYSGVNMLKSFASVPLQMCSDPPFSCDYPLGYCRPGDATCTIRQKQFYFDSDR